MLIKSAAFAKSVHVLSQLPGDGRPELAFAGRSNVGKSSFINTLLGRKKLALVSKEPGRTQSLNFYLINDVLYFVDLPGYGYAKVAADLRKRWKPLIEGYLSERPPLRGLAILFDIRRMPDDQDLSLIQWLKIHHLPILIVLSKADKLPRSKRPAQVSRIAETLSVKENEIVVFSVVTREGPEHFWKWAEGLGLGPVA